MTAPAIRVKHIKRQASVCFACQNQSVWVPIPSIPVYELLSFHLYFRTFPLNSKARYRVFFFYLHIFFKSLFCMSNKTILDNKKDTLPHSVRSTYKVSPLFITIISTFLIVIITNITKIESVFNIFSVFAVVIFFVCIYILKIYKLTHFLQLFAIIFNMEYLN